MTDADLSSRSIDREPGMTGDWTPGPWDYDGSDGDGYDFYIVDPKSGFVLATVHWYMEGGDKPIVAPAEANARLVSAAPELFKACEALTRALASFAKVVALSETIATGRPDERKAAEGIFAVIEQGRAAIAKATGASS